MITLKFILNRLICRYFISRNLVLSHWLSIGLIVILLNPCFGWNYKLDFRFKCTLIKYLFVQQIWGYRSWIYYLIAIRRPILIGNSCDNSAINIIKVFCVFNCQIFTLIINIIDIYYKMLILIKELLQSLCEVTIYLSHFQIGRRRTQYCITFQCIK